MLYRKFFLLFIFLIIRHMASGQKIIPLYPGKAPGSEKWAYQEQTQKLGGRAVMAFNIAQPTLTVYPADPKIANGTAVIVCPGGAFHMLSMTNEGTEVAQWLNKLGVTAFVLKYRLVGTSGNFGEVSASLKPLSDKELDAINAHVVPLSVADGLQAVTYVRQHAGKYQVQPNRIGMMGFSAGGTVTVSVGQTYQKENRPDFIAAIYVYAGAILGKVQPAAPPLFMAWASDDRISNGNPDLYKKWRDAKASVEMHVYPTGGHGFGMNHQNLPSDHWVEAFKQWLSDQGLIAK